MNRKQLAHNLAASLSGGDWTDAWLRMRLRQRLPTPLQRYAPKLAAELIIVLPGQATPAPARIVAALIGSKTLDKVLKHCRSRNVWPDPDLTPPRMAPVPALSTLELPQLPTVADLADWLCLSQDRLDYLTDPTGRFESAGDFAINHYRYLSRPKASGGLRLIESPKPGLKSLQRRILRGILNHVPAHPDAFGFVPGRSCLDAARRHAGEAVVVCFDLADFFPTVAARRVHGLYRTLGYPHGVAGYLAALCLNRTPSRILDRLPGELRATYRQPHLPQGAPTSPALANLAAFRLDRRLSGLARTLGANYSRYADDLSFSGDRHIAPALMRAVPAIVAEEGFRLNRGKTRVMGSSTRQVVTGIVVNRHLNVSRDRHDRIKAILHACAKAGDNRLDDPGFRDRLAGQIDWIAQVNPARGQKLRERFAAACSSRTSSGPDHPG